MGLQSQTRLSTAPGLQAEMEWTPTIQAPFLTALCGEEPRAGSVSWTEVGWAWDSRPSCSQLAKCSRKNHSGQGACN